MDRTFTIRPNNNLPVDRYNPTFNVTGSHSTSVQISPTFAVATPIFITIDDGVESTDAAIQSFDVSPTTSPSWITVGVPVEYRRVPGENGRQYARQYIFEPQVTGRHAVFSTGRARIWCWTTDGNDGTWLGMAYQDMGDDSNNFKIINTFEVDRRYVFNVQSHLNYDGLVSRIHVVLLPDSIEVINDRPIRVGDTGPVGYFFTMIYGHRDPHVNAYPERYLTRSAIFSSTAPGTLRIDAPVRLTALQPGNATLVVTSAIDSSLYGRRAVTIGQQRPTSISLSPNNVSLSLNGMQQLTVTVSPPGADNTVTYSVSNTNVI